MANFINIYSSITEYNADETKQYPNVSYLEAEDEVKWVAEKPKVVGKYYANRADNNKILGETSAFTEIEVDGVVQPSVNQYITFSTLGEHTIKYTLVDSTTIDQNAFYGCGLTSVTIPDSVTSIGLRAFQRCTGLTSVTIGSGVTTIGGSAFSQCTRLTSVTIPNSVTSIGNYAFSSCKFDKITIPDSVTSIGDYAFSECTGLTTITIPDSVTSIGGSAFRQGRSLTTVSIGSGITNLGAWAFGNNNTLTDFTIRAVTPPTTSSPFISVTSDFTIYVPSASVNTYKTASGWSSYASRIQAIQ